MILFSKWGMEENRYVMVEFRVGPRQLLENKYKDVEIGPDYTLRAMFFVLKVTF